MLAASQPQHMVALERANVTRKRRAEVKRQIEVGSLCPADLIRAVPSELETMTVLDLLRAQRGWQRIKSREFLSRFRISEGRQLGTLTERQRTELSAALRARRNGR